MYSILGNISVLGIGTWNCCHDYCRHHNGSMRPIASGCHTGDSEDVLYRLIKDLVIENASVQKNS
jgi:hypothetical protein